MADGGGTRNSDEELVAGAESALAEAISNISSVDSQSVAGLLNDKLDVKVSESIGASANTVKTKSSTHGFSAVLPQADLPEPIFTEVGGGSISSSSEGIYLQSGSSSGNTAKLKSLDRRFIADRDRYEVTVGFHIKYNHDVAEFVGFPPPDPSTTGGAYLAAGAGEFRVENGSGTYTEPVSLSPKTEYEVTVTVDRAAGETTFEIEGGTNKSVTISEIPTHGNGHDGFAQVHHDGNGETYMNVRYVRMIFG